MEGIHRKERGLLRVQVTPRQLPCCSSQRSQSIAAMHPAPAAVTDAQVVSLRDHGFTDKGIVQITHVVSDFSSYNTLNLALDTDYDYREAWKQLAGFAAPA